jgi:hypothetical protein
VLSHEDLEVDQRNLFCYRCRYYLLFDACAWCSSMHEPACDKIRIVGHAVVGETLCPATAAIILNSVTQAGGWAAPVQHNIAPVRLGREDRRLL